MLEENHFEGKIVNF